MLGLLVFLLAAPAPPPTAPTAPAARPAVKALAALLTTHGWPPAERRADLDTIAAALAARLAGAHASPETARAHLDWLLAERSITSAQVQPLIVEHADADGLARHLPRLLGRLDRRMPPTHFGVGIHAGPPATTALVLMHQGVAHDAPPPRVAAPGAMITVGGRLRDGYFQPRVLLDPPGDAPTREWPAVADGRRVEARFGLDDGLGIYTLEIVADSQYGPVVLDVWRIHVGVPPPPRPVVRVMPTPAEIDPGVALRQLIDAHRHTHQLPPLVPDARLQKVAGQHASEMAERGALRHHSPDTGTLATRLREVGFTAAAVAENLAHAGDPTAAMRAFLESPGHRRNLLDPRLTHIGVGVRGDWYAIALARPDG